MSEDVPAPRPDDATIHPCVLETPWQNWRAVGAEFFCMLIFLFLGLSMLVLFNTPIIGLPDLISDNTVRLVVASMAFSVCGTLVALSPFGKLSGSHINPAMTLAFALSKKITPWNALGYMAVQMLGAVLACLILYVWGDYVHRINYGLTLPGKAMPLSAVFMLEMAMTCCMVLLIFYFSSKPKLRAFTAWVSIPYYGFLGWMFAPLTGLSTNPARSFGPALISEQWSSYWIYVLAPLTGAAFAAWLVSNLVPSLEPPAARTVYSESVRDAIDETAAEQSRKKRRRKHKQLAAVQKRSNEQL